MPFSIVVVYRNFQADFRSCHTILYFQRQWIKVPASPHIWSIYRHFFLGGHHSTCIGMEYQCPRMLHNILNIYPPLVFVLLRTICTVNSLTHMLNVRFLKRYCCFCYCCFQLFMYSTYWFPFFKVVHSCHYFFCSIFLFKLILSNFVHSSGSIYLTFIYLSLH